MAKGIKKPLVKKSVPLKKKGSTPALSKPLDYTKIKGVFVGSGSDGLNEAEVRDQIVSLTGKKKTSDINVLYIGTATYDLDGPRQRQTVRFKEAGCKIHSLDCALVKPNKKKLEAALKNKDVIIISGGNSLYAVDRLKKLGVGPMIEEAVKRDRTILSGGSAGALCWFDAGHSDSMDPATYKDAMLGATFTDESQVGGGKNKKWKYIRIPMFGFLPGLVAPHHDKV